MRALFIDFDGVLHPAGDGLEDVGPLFVWLPLLAEALARHEDVLVVVHSTWRYQYTLQELQELLASLSVDTTTAPRGPRAEAIRWFLQMNPTVTTHRILDDDGKEFDPLPDELLLCNSRQGLTTPGVLEELKSWLRQTRP